MGRKLLVIILGFSLILIMLGCVNDEGKDISKNEAEKIALAHFEKDLKDYNETTKDKINSESIELISNETNFNSVTKTWDVSFNYKDGLLQEEASNSVAQYSIDLSGEIFSKSINF
ncbi:hypothetical protein [Rossellomorea marisflavi]|uniref:hypothetical protein n=1 Tax=Rossellomorea marisflavi TaxID=189381 RepID=UPI0011E89550|nr:hypothetical protein [Rossellomorea marisflavi]TYO68604.1 hypothetical protein DQ398_003770 [Rossellomorea marisflavi]